jgi:DNA-binding NarL/FixJ family response regulator
MNYDEALFALSDEIDRAVVRAAQNGLTDKEIAAELRRVAEEVEREGAQ